VEIRSHSVEVDFKSSNSPSSQASRSRHKENLMHDILVGFFLIELRNATSAYQGMTATHSFMYCPGDHNPSFTNKPQRVLTPIGISMMSHNSLLWLSRTTLKIRVRLRCMTTSQLNITISSYSGEISDLLVKVVDDTQSTDPIAKSWLVVAISCLFK
jgi:hypothetical protein